MNENNELLDLVDANDVVISTIRRGDMAKARYKLANRYVRFAEAFILNQKGQIWVPIRGAHKVIAPGGCDFSVAEHVLSGESYNQAIERAFLEEADLIINSAALTFLGKLPPTTDKPVFESVYLYKIPSGQTPKYSRQEFYSASWMSPHDFKDLLLHGPPTKSALLPAFKLLQNFMNNQKSNLF